MKNSLINIIISRELDMFLKVSNIGGQAPCQKESANFTTMRRIQWEVWPDKALDSYLSDLENAISEGRNLLTEKYAYMMESTLPEEYNEIKDRLPALSSQKLDLIENILQIHITWKEDLIRDYPYLSQRGRPLYTSQDTPNSTSIETYMRGELKTYSLKTLKLYYNHVLEEKSKEVNEAKIVLENTVKNNGYKTLEEANENIKIRMKK